MRRLLNDLRAWTLLSAAVLGLGAVRLVDRALPLPELSGAWDPRVMPIRSDLSGGGTTVAPLPEARLVELAGQASVADLVDLRPLAGHPLLPTMVGDQRVDLPQGLLPLLDAGVDGPALDLAIGDALAAVRDPTGLVAQTPGLQADLQVRIEAGLRAELVAWAPRLVGGAPVGHRDRLLLQGIGRDAAWQLPAAVAVDAEPRTYEAWLDLAQTWYQQHDIPVSRFDLGLPLDAASPGAFDLEGWVADWVIGTPPAADPFFALGRLQAVHLLARADLLSLVFAGHGHQVADPQGHADRFGAYRIGPLAMGDSCDELAILRSHRGGLSVRYGLCLPPGSAHSSLSCSMVSDGSSGPQHSSAMLAWFLEHGSWPAYGAIEPAAFRLFPVLQRGQLAATSAAQLTQAAVDTVASGRRLLGAATTRAGDLAFVAPGVWRLRVGGEGQPDLVIMDASVGQVDAALSLRIAQATASWRLWRAGPAGILRTAELIDLCGESEGCAGVLDSLAPVPGLASSPTAAPMSAVIRNHSVRLSLAPDDSNPWLRLAVIQGPDEDRGSYLDRLWRLQHGLSRASPDALGMTRRTAGPRRVLGLHLDQG